MSFRVSFVLLFFSPFSIAITSLGEERANLSAFRTFVRFVLVWICRFPLYLGVWEGLWFVIVALPGLFSYLFFWCFSYVCSICACLVLSVPSSSWCLGRAAVCDCGTPLTFLLPLFWGIGLRTVQQYSSLDLTRERYAVVFVTSLLTFRFLRKKPSMLFPCLMVWSMCFS